MAVSVFIGSVALLSYISEWDDFEDSSVFSSAVGKIITSIEATAVSLSHIPVLFSIPVFITSSFPPVPILVFL